MEYDAETMERDEFGEPEPLPKWPKPVGILSIVFGGLTLTCVGGSVAMMPVWAGMVKGQLGGDPLPPNLTLSMLEIFAMAASLSVNLLLVIAGAMCVARKGAARGMHLLYGLLMFGVVGLGVVVQLSERAQLEQWLHDYPNSEMAKAMAGQSQSAAGLIIAVAITAVSLAWPVFCLIWFGASGKKPDAGMTELVA
ncbi:MAG: hypothetical protein RBS39_04855 [Phycisphaerales bacterium]|jgi:hypothetical protein|nr:hypothetical protein [Phycisphaerales bacterium]